MGTESSILSSLGVYSNRVEEQYKSVILEIAFKFNILTDKSV